MKIFHQFIFVLCVAFCISSEDGHFTNKFAVSLNTDVHDSDQSIREIADSLGFTVEHKYESINVYLLSHPSVRSRSKRSADQHLTNLRTHPQVLHAQQEIELVRVKREIIYDKQLEIPIREITDPSVYHRIAAPRLSVKDQMPRSVVHFKDPFYSDQWYINNYGQSGGKVGLDLNVMIAWQKNFNGSGIVVCILDDGIDHNHLDLFENYDPRASTDLNDLTDKKKDPMPNKVIPGNSHGTRCAGEIAAQAGNNVCGVGLAFGARIGGVRMLDGNVSDSLEAAALNFNINYIDIFSASWGPTDDGKTMEGPKHYAANALYNGATYGRKGKGVIYAWATGNGGNNDDDCGADGYVSSIYTLSFGSSTDRGHRPYFMENCTSTLAVVPSGGEEVKGEESNSDKIKLKVVTTDVDNKCIENFQGTSSAAPLAAACMALVLQANPHVTWRDVQHIVVRGSRIPSVDNSWVINGANLHVSHSFGFGVMDCGEMVRLAQDWQLVPEQHICHYSRQGLYKSIPHLGHAEDFIYVYDGCVNEKKSRIDRLEHVQINIKIDHERRGDIQIFLMSPSGTRSEMLSPRSNDDYNGGLDFTFMTVHSWMEQPHGVWKLEVYSNPGSSGRLSSGNLIQWELVLYGTAGYHFTDVSARHAQKQQAMRPMGDHLTKLMEAEEERSKRLTLKRSNIRSFDKKGMHGEYYSDSDVIRLLKELVDGKSEDHGMTNRLHSDTQSGDDARETYKHVRSKQEQYLGDESLSGKSHMLNINDARGSSQSVLSKQDQHLGDDLSDGKRDMLNIDNARENSQSALSKQDQHQGDDSLSDGQPMLDGDEELIDMFLEALDDEFEVDDKHGSNSRTPMKKPTDNKQYSRKVKQNPASRLNSRMNSRVKQADDVKKALEDLLEIIKSDR